MISIVTRRTSASSSPVVSTEIGGSTIRRYFPVSGVPRRKDRNYRRFGSQSEFGHDESRRGRNAEEVNKNRLVVECVQVRQQAERGFARAQDLQHRARGGEFVDSRIAEFCADAFDHFLDARIVDSAHEERDRVTKKRKTKARQLPSAEMAGAEHQLLAVLATAASRFSHPRTSMSCLSSSPDREENWLNSPSWRPRLVETLAQQLSAFFVRLFRECETKICGPRAPQITR